MTAMIAVRLSEDLHGRLLRLKEMEYGKPITQIIREAIGEHLKKKGVK